MSKRVTVQCAVCGKTIERFASQAVGKESFCSKDCLHIRNGGKVPATCQICGKVVYLKKTLAARTKYCSYVCKYEAHSKALAGRQYKEMVPVTCGICGTVRLFPPSVAPTRRFCSRACDAEKKRREMRGEKNANWRGGYDPYYGPSWDEQRRKTRERDNYTCQVCGITEDTLNRKLDVHHIRRFKSFNGDFDNANHLDNLVSLCQKCHSAVEHNPDLL